MVRGFVRNSCKCHVLQTWPLRDLDYFLPKVPVFGAAGWSTSCLIIWLKCFDTSLEKDKSTMAHWSVQRFHGLHDFLSEGSTRGQQLSAGKEVATKYSPLTVTLRLCKTETHTHISTRTILVSFITLPLTKHPLILKRLGDCIMLFNKCMYDHFSSTISLNLELYWFMRTISYG